MSIEPIESISSRILAQYDKNPKSWSVLVDRRNNILVLGPDGGFRLKLLPLGPNKSIGVGVQTDRLTSIRDILEGTTPYGLRPLSRVDQKKLLGAMRHGGLDRRLVHDLLGKPPVSTAEIHEMRPDVVVSGPFVLHPDLGAISEGQRELEKKLTVEAEKLFRKKYPLRAGIYR